MLEFSVPASFTVGDLDNVVGSVFAHERDDPDHVIIQRLKNGSWTDVTCAQVAAQVRSTALGLIAEGVGAGDRVAVLSATRYEWPIIDLAILSVGAVTVPIYETSSAEQVAWILRDSAAVAAFVETEEHAKTVAQTQLDLPEGSLANGSGIKFTNNDWPTDPKDAGQNLRASIGVWQWQKTGNNQIFPAKLATTEPVMVPLPSWSQR